MHGRFIHRRGFQIAADAALIPKLLKLFRRAAHDHQQFGGGQRPIQIGFVGAFIGQAGVRIEKYVVSAIFAIGALVADASLTIFII